MLTAALTGGIATGKSHVLERFRRLGAACLDADELAHGVTGAGTEATQAIAARFGAAMLDATGAVDRKKLGPLVFADPAARRDLEAIVHPAVYRAITAGLRAFELTGSAIAIVDIPLLYENGRAGALRSRHCHRLRAGDAAGAAVGTRAVGVGRTPAVGGADTGRGKSGQGRFRDQDRWHVSGNRRPG